MGFHVFDGIASAVALGRVHTNSAEMLSSRHGDYRYERIAPPAGSARQRQTAELAGAQRDPVRRAGLQVARAAASLRQLHTVYTRMNRWSKNGVLDRVFEHLQREQIVRIKLEAVSLDSTIVKVHPDGTGALKKRTPVHRQVPGRLDHQDSYGCRGCSNRHILALPGPGPRRAGRA